MNEVMLTGQQLVDAVRTRARARRTLILASRGFLFENTTLSQTLLVPVETGLTCVRLCAQLLLQPGSNCNTATADTLPRERKPPTMHPESSEDAAGITLVPCADVCAAAPTDRLQPHHHTHTHTTHSVRRGLYPGAHERADAQADMPPRTCFCTGDALHPPGRRHATTTTPGSHTNSSVCPSKHSTL